MTLTITDASGMVSIGAPMAPDEGRRQEASRARGRVAEGLNNREVAELYERYGHLILERCQRVLRDPTLADDALQNTFIKVMRHGAGLREASSPLGYLYRTAHRCCFDLFNKRSRRSERSLPELPSSSHPDPRFEARDLVAALLGDLRSKDREIAVRFFLEGASQGEIAEALGLSRQSINKRVQKIRERAERLRDAHRAP